MNNREKNKRSYQKLENKNYRIYPKSHRKSTGEMISTFLPYEILSYQNYGVENIGQEAQR